ncbi:phosphopantetheinyl transferase [Pseudonocardia nematodicida]|uniref:Phosphopantetheinyl transferase n=1 Tax=Pseudonocardia nematodicida TaxID=1206997 RepID=A0ABV1K8J2_9PSEU
MNARGGAGPAEGSVGADRAGAWGGAVVPYGGLTDPAALVAPMPVNGVFSRSERLRSGAGRTLQHWAGRLAAKRAVLRALGVEPGVTALGAVEVLPRPTPTCARDTACGHGHPPGVTLHPPLTGDPASTVRVSISHTDDLAVAVAVTGPALEEDAR